ncbi:hypothetical protein [Chitinophaga rhizophila]|uniref:Uncharacterized protein n=1 Tax=Chitinophaga rhizophila TaxID=2866212 RepID=A0ABS7G6D5_9BACT|nr:hypothetical protein [Chitinophaga rhizophila]MBW8683215.1 hypothetical protein [Chitinophaga rhizophila]
MKSIHTMRYLLLTGLLVFTASGYAQKAAPAVHGTHITKEGNTDIEEITTDKDGKLYHIILEEGKMTSLAIDGKEIPKENWNEYDSFVKALQEQLKKDRLQAEKDKEQARRDREQAQKDRLEANKHRQQANLDRQQAERDRQQFLRDREQFEKDRKQADIDRIQADKDREQALRDRAQAEKDRTQAEGDRQAAERDRKQADIDRARADKDRERAEIDRAAAEEDKKLIGNLVSDVVTDKLVATKSDIRELIIDSKGMTVNGAQQSADVHRRYLAKYQAAIKSGISYSAQNGHVQIQRKWNGQ